MVTPRRASSQYNSHKSHKTLMLGNLSDKPVILLNRTRRESEPSVQMEQTVNRMEKSAMPTEHAGSFVKFGKHSPSNRRWEQEGKVKKPVASHSTKSEGHSSPGDEDGGVLALAEKMKELELMDLGDVEHVLDLEEALHYYSLLTSPVFLDIVHKFFMEIYSEFSAAREPIRMNNSKRRFGSMEF